MWKWGNAFFLSTQGFFKSICLPFIRIYQHLSHSKTIKLKLLRQTKSSYNQPNPIRFKNCKTKELSTKYKTFLKLLSIVIAKIKSSNENSFRHLIMSTGNDVYRHYSLRRYHPVDIY